MKLLELANYVSPTPSINHNKKKERIVLLERSGKSDLCSFVSSGSGTSTTFFCSADGATQQITGYGTLFTGQYISAVGDFNGALLVKAVSKCHVYGVILNGYTQTYTYIDSDYNANQTIINNEAVYCCLSAY